MGDLPALFRHYEKALGEPLVRRGIDDLVRSLGRHLKTGDLDELTLTTNGSQLERHAETLVSAGVKRINVSIDSLAPDRFAFITRWGRLDQVLRGGEIGRASCRARVCQFG